MSSMTFVELLFWKNTRDAEEVREEYGWKVHIFCWWAISWLFTGYMSTESCR